MGFETMRASFTVAIFVVASFLASFGTACAEENNYEAGKAPAELFHANCGGCHNSPKGLGVQMGRMALHSYLGEHYTASAASANELTRYLLSVNANAAQHDRPREARSSSARQAR